jgi:hypothetical protein
MNVLVQLELAQEQEDDASRRRMGTAMADGLKAYGNAYRSAPSYTSSAPQKVIICGGPADSSRIGC